MQKFSYHTHTNFSDGRNTLEEILTRAVELGWEEIGISDHLQVHKNIEETAKHKLFAHFQGKDFKSVLPRYAKQIEKIRKTAKNYPLKVYVGFEADYFTYDGWEEEFKEFTKSLEIDYLINGNHYAISEDNSKLIDLRQLKELEPDAEKQRSYLSGHFRTINKAVQSGLSDFIAHLDYARLSEICGEFDFKPEKMEIIESLAKTNTAYEINTKKLIILGSFIPAEWMIAELCKRNVPTVLSDDAHDIGGMNIFFNEAESLLKKYNYQNRFKL